MIDLFKNKVLLITGGTGSFGNVVVKKFVNTDIKEIRVFSRDEKKQDDMRKELNNKKIKFYIGDVRDPRSLSQAFRGVDFCFHAAALKQVPSCEFHPMEAVKTNIIGTENVLEAAITNNVRKIVCLSTDKSVYPINSMGLSKAMMEKVMIATSRNILSASTTVCCTRYGNVMATRGSIIPLIIKQIESGVPITITDPAMTRFIMTLEDAVDLVLYAFNNCENGDIFVQKSSAVTIDILVKSILNLLDQKNYKINIIGTRHGEKLYESLLSKEERLLAEDLGNYFRIPPDLRDLNYGKFVEQGVLSISDHTDYNSHNTNQLSQHEMEELLLELPYFQENIIKKRKV